LLVGCIAVPIYSTAINIGTTKYCSLIITDLPNAQALSLVCPLIHDSLIFIATSWALRNSYYNIDVKNGIRAMVLGKHLHPFSRSILRNGQAYYL
jgi:hypothetical protein